MMAVRNRLIVHFESRIRQLQAAGAELVVLDLTGNSGGYNWYEPLGRVLTGKDLPRPPMSFVRGPDTVAELEDAMARLDRTRALCPLPRVQRQLLEQSYCRLEAARIEASAPCRRSEVWWVSAATPGLLPADLAHGPGRRRARGDQSPAGIRPPVSPMRLSHPPTTAGPA